MTAIGWNASSCLFGSGARGDAHEGSDYDIAVFWKGLTDRWREFHRLADLRTEILADTGIFIEARPFRAAACRERTPLRHEIRRDGVTLQERTGMGLFGGRGRLAGR
jgi:predicted nucleotidyltransferase